MRHQNLNIKKIVFATHNEGKIKDLNLFFKQSKLNDIEIVTAKDLKIAEPAEIENSFEKNALIKAQYVAEQTNLPAIADDSGLCIEKLNDFPGVRSAELAEELGKTKRDFGKAMQYVLDKLGVNEQNRKAKFVTCLCLYIAEQEPLFFVGEIKGNIAKKILGDGGFGYDPIFIPNGAKLTFGQMGTEEKNTYPTHRICAMEKFLAYLKAQQICL